MEITNEPRQGLRLHIWGASGISHKSTLRLLPLCVGIVYFVQLKYVL
jgi:hypothetical protein